MSRLDLSWLNLWTASGSKAETLRGFGGVSDAEDDCEEDVGQSPSSMDSETEADGMDTEQDSSSRSSDSEDNIATVATAQEQQQSTFLRKPQLARISSLKSDDDIPTETFDSQWSMCVMSRRKKRTVVQHPSAALFLRGLWEEEEHCRRQKQMIPEGVHKPLRSKVLNRKPLVRTVAAKASNPLSKSPSLSTGSGCSPDVAKWSHPSRVCTRSYHIPLIVHWLF